MKTGQEIASNGLPIWLWRMLALSLVLLGGCAQLPSRPSLPVVVASAPDPESPLGKMAAAALARDSKTGMRLLPVASAAFATRIELARQAVHSIDVQYYLLSADNTGEGLMRALREAAARGVRVRILVDDLYTSGEDDVLRSLSAFPNVEVRLFNPFPGARGSMFTRFATTLDGIQREDHRMHNKLFIVDGEAAVAGGRNMADEYFMRSTTNNFIDFDVFLVGPAVRDLSSIFDRYWNSEFSFPSGLIIGSSGSELNEERRFDVLTSDVVAPPEDEIPPDSAGYVTLPAELQRGRIESLITADVKVYADPIDKIAGAHVDDRSGTVTEQVLKMIQGAQHDVVLVSPYFVPGSDGLKLMRSLTARGVDVTAITNSLASTDEALAYVAYSGYRVAMLESGVHIRELSPTLARDRGKLGVFHKSLGEIHAKLAIVDQRYVFMGSMNLDLRSAYENTELGLIIDSPELAMEILSRADVASSYTLRLVPERKIQWIAHSSSGEVVFDDEPEAGFWDRLQTEFLAPILPQKQF